MFSGLCLGLGEAPEIACQFELIKGRLVLFASVGLPAGRQPVAPPGVRQLTQLRHADRGSRFAPAEPPFDVLFRPEEIHRASRKDDVIPPTPGRNQTMKHQAHVIDLLVANLELEPLTAVQT